MTLIKERNIGYKKERTYISTLLFCGKVGCRNKIFYYKNLKTTRKTEKIHRRKEKSEKQQAIFVNRQNISVCKQNKGLKKAYKKIKTKNLIKSP